MKPSSFLYQWMKLFSLLLSSGAFIQVAARTPAITSTQYIVKVTGYLPNDYDALRNVYYTRQMTFYDQAGSITSNMDGYGSGNYTSEQYVTEANKPLTMSVRHNVHYEYYHCESYDPNCDNGGGGVSYVRQAGKKPTSGKGGSSSARTSTAEPCGSCWYQYTSFYSCYLNNIPLRYPISDTTIQSGNAYVTISVRPAGDQNYNLPSSDNISIKAEGDISGYSWEYQLLGSTSWVGVPGHLVVPGGREIILNGQSLFGGSWMSHINKTVMFRLKNNNNQTSNILLYTHRLSSPRIIGVQTFQNPCHGFDTAYIKIKLDRQLIADEKLNIFLKDTALGLDYSALNLTNANLDATNTYTWPAELVQGGYKISMIGKYFDYATYTGSSGHFAFAKVTDPELIRFYLHQDPVLCFDGNSGKIKIAAKGGVGNFKFELLNDTLPFVGTWTPFVNPYYNAPYQTYEVFKSGLTSQLYKVRVRDGNDCVVRDSLGREIYKTVKVGQPTQALQLSMLTVSPITAHHLNNGAITVRLSGGTPYPWSVETQNTYQKYTFEWRDSATGAAVTNYSLDTNGKFQTSIHNLPEGTYRFTAKDASWVSGSANNQQGCLIDVFIKVVRPNPLQVYIATDTAVKCYGEQNAVLRAVASGGVPVTDSLKYNFTWYKWNGGSWLNLNKNDSVLSMVGAGTYRVNIGDKYNNLKQSNDFVLSQPAQLGGLESTTPASCYFTPNGHMSVSASGGTAPYSYEWSTGDLTPSVDSVAGGTYVVVIKDANLCLATKQVVVTSPGKINTTVTTTPVGCSGTASGSISLAPSGGAGGYTYLWSTGQTSAVATGLGAGRYWYRITDANGCYDTDTLELENPEGYTIDAGPDRKICIGQSIPLRVSHSQVTNPLNISWSTPGGVVTGNPIQITSAGTYIVTVSNASGCQRKDTVTVTFENANVNTSFTVSTQAFAGENTTLVNISPQQQDSAVWILPANSGITLISQSKAYCELKFADTGKYTVGIRAYYSNGCIDEKYKDVHVVSKVAFTNLGNQADAFLKQFTLYPNPTSGSFTLDLLFNSVTVARVRIINVLTNTTVSDRMLQGAASYTSQFDVGMQPAGTYIVVIETAKGNFVHKLNKL